MPSLLLLGGLGALAVYLWSQSSSGGGASATLPPLPPSQANATLASTQQGTVTYDPTTYGPLSSGAGNQQAVPSGNVTPVANAAAPGSATGATSSAGAPLFHTGFSDANSGAVIATDETGNPYLV